MTGTWHGTPPSKLVLAHVHPVPAYGDSRAGVTRRREWGPSEATKPWLRTNATAPDLDAQLARHLSVPGTQITRSESTKLLTGARNWRPQTRSSALEGDASKRDRTQCPHERWPHTQCDALPRRESTAAAVSFEGPRAACEERDEQLEAMHVKRVAA